MSSSEGQYGRKTRTIQVDFTAGHSIYPAIAEELQGLEIGILGNGTTNYSAEESHWEVIKMLYKLRNIEGKELIASQERASNLQAIPLENIN